MFSIYHQQTVLRHWRHGVAGHWCTWWRGLVPACYLGNATGHVCWCGVRAERQPFAACETGKLWIHCHALSWMPWAATLERSLRCGTVLKVFWKSMLIVTTLPPASRICVHESRTSRRCVTQDCPLTKPCLPQEWWSLLSTEALVQSSECHAGNLVKAASIVSTTGTCQCGNLELYSNSGIGEEKQTNKQTNYAETCNRFPAVLAPVWTRPFIESLCISQMSSIWKHELVLLTFKKGDHCQDRLSMPTNLFNFHLLQTALAYIVTIEPVSAITLKCTKSSWIHSVASEDGGPVKDSSSSQ